MINALDLKCNKKYYKKEICENILKEIELLIIETDNLVGHGCSTKEYPVYIQGKQGYWETIGNIKKDLTQNDIEYIENSLREANFKIGTKRYKDSNTICWWIDWSNILYTDLP